jgi:hypothetical protein
MDIINKTNNFIILFLLIAVLSSFSDDLLKEADELDYNGNYNKALKLLADNNKESSPDIQIIWRIGRETFEIANNLSSKNDKIKFYDEGIIATKPYININMGRNRDRAEVIHWYAANYASKMKVLGIFAGQESIKVVPNVFKLMDKCLEIDPSYAPAYFFKGKLLEDVPSFLGGDKFEMAIYYQDTLKYAGENEKLFFLIDIAKSFYNRNWDVNKKKRTAKNKKNNSGDGTPQDLSDREFAYQLLLEAKEKYDNNKSFSKREIDKSKELIKLLEEIKK